jgi:hypothetical protein
MFKEPLIPNLYEMKVGWTLIRLCVGDIRFVQYLLHEQAEVISFFRYVDPEPTGEDVQRARELLEGWKEAA